MSVDNKAAYQGMSSLVSEENIEDHQYTNQK